MVDDLDKENEGPKMYWANWTKLGAQFTNAESELAFGSQFLQKLEDKEWLKVHRKYVVAVDEKGIRLVGKSVYANVNRIYDDKLTLASVASRTVKACDTGFLMRTINEMNRGKFVKGGGHVCHVMVLFFLKINGDRVVVCWDPLTRSAAHDVRKGGIPTIIRAMLESNHHPISQLKWVHGNQVGSSKDCLKRSAEFLESCLANKKFYEQRILSQI